MKRLRVFVVEDSLTVRRHLVDVLSSQEDIEVVGEASDGKSAIDRCKVLRPDVITLDMDLPTMSGLAVTEYVMAYMPTPILIVSASVNRAELFRTYDALSAGAVDVLEKPTGTEDDDEWDRRLVVAVRMVARIQVLTHPRARLAQSATSAATPSPPTQPPDPERSWRLVALGASTGGPGALLRVLGGLPADFPLPILIVIHISDLFGGALAEWLDGQLPFQVRYATDGEPLPDLGSCRVLLAPAGRHMVVRDGRLHLTGEPERHSCRPSVDVLFESLARELGDSAAACLLTGMGRDGAAGLLTVRQAGGETIAQDEATSVIFGMPGEAVRLGAAKRVLPLESIAPALVRLGRPASKGGYR